MSLAKDLKPNTGILLFILFFVVLAIVFTSLYFGDKHGDKNCNCTSDVDAGLMAGGYTLAGILLGIFLILFADPTVFTKSNMKTNWIPMIVISVLAVGATVGWTFYGQTLGDPNCECHSPIHISADISASMLVLTFCCLIFIMIFQPGFLSRSIPGASGLSVEDFV